MSQDPPTREAAHRTAVVLVANPAAPYSRGLRVARALAAEGYAVTIAAVAAAGLPAREQDGEIAILRVAPRGFFRRWSAVYEPPAAPGMRQVAAPASSGTTTAAEGRDPGPAAAGSAGGHPPRARSPVIVRAARYGRRLVERTMIGLTWPRTVRAWWAGLREEAPDADLYHAFGSLTIPVALELAQRARRRGRAGRVVYDAIDILQESNNVIQVPPPIRWWMSRRERRWAALADARTTVNQALADRLVELWRVPDRPLVLPNYPDSRPSVQSGTGPADASDPIRRATGLPASTRIVLFEGRLSPNCGLSEAAEAVLRLPDAALVLIGFGRWTSRCLARDAEPRYAGRHFTLPAVHPDALLDWTAAADVMIVPLPPVSRNQRLSTPNKFWEALAAGIPVVVGPGLDVMARLVVEHDLGALARSLAPDDLAAALATVLDVTPQEREKRRERIAAVARERFSWPRVAAEYRALVRGLDGQP